MATKNAAPDRVRGGPPFAGLGRGVQSVRVVVSGLPSAGKVVRTDGISCPMARKRGGQDLSKSDGPIPHEVFGNVRGAGVRSEV